jgi:hypothetical protein
MAWGCRLYPPGQGLGNLPVKNSNLAHVQFVLQIPNLMKTLNHKITVSLRILIRRSQIMIFRGYFFRQGTVHTVFLDEKRYSGKMPFMFIYIFFFFIKGCGIWEGFSFASTGSESELNGV